MIGSRVKIISSEGGGEDKLYGISLVTLRVSILAYLINYILDIGRIRIEKRTVF